MSGLRSDLPLLRGAGCEWIRLNERKLREENNRRVSAVFIRPAAVLKVLVHCVLMSVGSACDMFAHT